MFAQSLLLISERICLTVKIKKCIFDLEDLWQIIFFFDICYIKTQLPQNKAMHVHMTYDIFIHMRPYFPRQLYSKLFNTLVRRFHCGKIGRITYMGLIRICYMIMVIWWSRIGEEQSKTGNFLVFIDNMDGSI